MSYYRYTKTIFSLSFSLWSQYRLDALLQLLVNTAWLSLSVGSIFILFSYISEIGGWTKEMVYLLPIISSCIDAAYWAFFGEGVSRFVDDLILGTFDQLLLKPKNTFLLAVFREIQLSGLTMFFANIGILGVSLWYLVPDITAKQVGLGLLSSLVGFGILLAIQVGIALLSFWFPKSQYFIGTWYAVYGATRYPASAYPKFIQRALLTIIPAGVIVAFPTLAFFGRIGFVEVIYATVVMIFFWSIIMLVWRHGLRTYSSASS